MSILERSVWLAGILAVWCCCAHGADWEHCKRVTWAFNVTDFSLNPDPIEAGSPATFSLFTEHDIDVEDGSLTASVQYFGFKVFSKTGPLCEPVSCPIDKGTNVLDFVENMPGFLPPGKLVLTLHGKRADNLDLFCVKVNLYGKKERQVKDAHLGSRLGVGLKSL